jgi:fatty-acyl-CoA synthase
VQPRDHVGVLMPNTLEYLLLFYGCALLGAHPVHFNSRYKLDDLRYVIVDSDIKVLLTSAKQREHADHAAMLRELFPALATWRFGTPLEIAAAPRLQSVYCFHADDSHGWGTERDFMARAAETPVSLQQVDPEDVGLIMYTSGTTAKPKACLLPHRALEGAGHALAERWRMSCTDRFWDPLPFFHMSTMLPLAACRGRGRQRNCQRACDHSLPLVSDTHERPIRASRL